MTIEFEDTNLFEYKIIFSLLSQKKIKTKYDESKFTTNFLSLIRLLTHQTSTEKEIIHNEKYLYFTPGSIVGGKHKFNCLDYPISNYLLPIMIISPFTKKIFDLTFTGITNAADSLSCDTIRLIHTKILEKFGVSSVSMSISRRGFAPEGQGEVKYVVSNVQNLHAIEFEQSKLYKIRGMAITSRVNSSIAHDMILRIRKCLGSDSTENYIDEEDSEDSENSPLTRNVKIFCDIANRNDSGPSPGYQCVLFAEGKNFYFGEFCKTASINSDPCENDVTLDTMVEESVLQLLEAIDYGGAFDHKCNKILFSFLCLNLPDINKVKIGGLSDDDKEFLKLLNDFFGFTYEIKNLNEKLIFTSFGVNYTNYFKILQ